MSYVALYRKFRPKTFDEIKGQEQVTVILKNQLKSERIGHAYLFSGTRGTGKTSAAKIFAKAVNCENPVDGNPCLVCESCKRIEGGGNLNIVEMDAAASNGVADIREVIEAVRYSPTEGKYKVYIIDEAHMLSKEAFNAFLKTLEEPPSYAIFILATTESFKIPITVRSRCQRYDFRRITTTAIGDRIKELLQAEGEEYEEEAVDFLARKGDGSMRDALSLLDQCLSFYFGEKLSYENVLFVLGAVDITYLLKLFQALKRKDVNACLDVVEEISEAGTELYEFVGDFIWFLRNLILLLVSTEAEKRIDVSADRIALMKEAVKGLREEELSYLIFLFSDLHLKMKSSGQKRVELEIALIKAARPETKVSFEGLLSRVAELERQLEEGNFLVRREAPQREEEPVLKAEEKKEVKKQVKAVPENLKKAVAGFQSVIRQPSIRQPLRSILEEASLFYEEESGALIIASKDESTKEWILKEENFSLVKKELERVAEGEIILNVKIAETAKKEGMTEILGLENIAPGLLQIED